MGILMVVGNSGESPGDRGAGVRLVDEVPPSVDVPLEVLDKFVAILGLLQCVVSCCDAFRHPYPGRI